jgi:hypothetical protein
MQNHELIKKLKDRIGDVSTEVPILVYTDRWCLRGHTVKMISQNH